MAYDEISSERADSRSTLITILGKMYQTFVVQQRQKWLLVVGDAKTYDIIRKIRSEYGDHMKWLTPWPGDWHILLNYQKAIMKAYVDAGLTKLGEVTQHRSENLTSLVQCSNFQRTQLLGTGNGSFLSLFLITVHDQEIHMEEGIHCVITGLVSEFSSLSCDSELDSFRGKVQNAISPTGVCFHTFMERLSQQQHTIRFWYQFVTVDIMAYFGLLLPFVTATGTFEMAA